MGPDSLDISGFHPGWAKVVYQLDLFNELNQIYNTFHVSHLWKCDTDESAVVPLDDIQIDDHRNYMERPVVILDWKMKALRNKEVSLVKVQWQHQKRSEWTWEPKAEMREHYPDLFAATDFKDKV